MQGQLSRSGGVGDGQPDLDRGRAAVAPRPGSSALLASSVYATVSAPPTGKPFEITVIDIVQFADGHAVEHWGGRTRPLLAPEAARSPALAEERLGRHAEVGLFTNP